MALRSGLSGSFFGGPPEPQVVVATGTVKPGDVFAHLLLTNGVSSKYIFPIQSAFSAKFGDLRRIQPNNFFEVHSSTDGEFLKLVYRTDATHFFTVRRSSANEYHATEDFIPTVWMEKLVTVSVSKFLDVDLRSAGVDGTLVDNLTYELGDNIFAWKIDFFTEQRPGDTLEALIEEEYMVGSDAPLKGGKHMRILAARYVGSGTKKAENIAIRFHPAGAQRHEFYDELGEAVRRAFLRAPFSRGAFRISSGFNPKRFHPILRTYRAHHGTDYAASKGTPVVAIGNGTVVRAEWYKGYGNCIDIRHSTKFTSRYGHLSKMAVKRGQRVAQGQHIGNVGSTGLSTGPHLHFEMLVDGAQRNFLRMTFPAASAVAAKDKPEFDRVRDELLARLKKAVALAAGHVENKQDTN